MLLQIYASALHAGTCGTVVRCPYTKKKRMVLTYEPTCRGRGAASLQLRPQCVGTDTSVHTYLNSWRAVQTTWAAADICTACRAMYYMARSRNVKTRWVQPAQACQQSGSDNSDLPSAGEGASEQEACRAPAHSVPTSSGCTQTHNAELVEASVTNRWNCSTQPAAQQLTGACS
jgi:hypothetical protein